MCGFEDSVNHASCGSCGCALSEAPGLYLSPTKDAEETAYELEISSEQRAGLVTALISDSIPHRWDTVEELVISTDHEDAVDALLDDVLHEDIQITLDESEDLDGDNESANAATDAEQDEVSALFNQNQDEATAAYETMDSTFQSAERLLNRWEAQDVGTFIGDATTVSLMQAPLGVDDEDWAEVALLARNCAVALQDDDQADVEDQVKELRDRLQNFL